MPRKRTTPDSISTIAIKPPCLRQDPKGHQTLEDYHSKNTRGKLHYNASKGGSAFATKRRGVTLPKFSWDKEGGEE